MKPEKDKKKIREALTTGLSRGNHHAPPITDTNIKGSPYYDHFKNSLKLTIKQIKTILEAPSFTEARKIKLPKSVPDFAVYQVRKYWGFKAPRMEWCFICDKPLMFEESHDEGVSTCLETPAVYWKTGGNWPSTILDMEHDKVEILICDDCIKPRKHKIFIIKEKEPTHRRTYTRKSFIEYRDEAIARIEATKAMKPQ